jgi:gluconolactonase
MAETQFRVLASGIGFTEGPLWLPSGELLVTSMSRGLVYGLRLDDPNSVTTYETGGGPNGLAVDKDDIVVVAQNGSATFPSRSQRPVRPGIQLIKNGEVIDELVKGCLTPNDLAFAPDGTLWFTDPGNSTDPTFAPRVSRYDFTSKQLDTAVTDVRFPNGLAFGPDGGFYLADSITNEILRFSWTPTGVFGRQIYCVVPNGSPDGIAFDADGSLYVAAFETDDVAIFGRDGSLERLVPMGTKSRPTNLCFAGEDLSTLVVTLASGGRVVALNEAFNGARP